MFKIQLKLRSCLCPVKDLFLPDPLSGRLWVVITGKQGREGLASGMRKFLILNSPAATPLS